MAKNKKTKTDTTAVETVQETPAEVAESQTTSEAASSTETEINENKLDTLKNVLSKQKQPEANKQKQLYTAMAGLTVVRY